MECDLGVDSAPAYAWWSGDLASVGTRAAASIGTGGNATQSGSRSDDCPADQLGVPQFGKIEHLEGQPASLLTLKKFSQSCFSEDGERRLVA